MIIIGAGGHAKEILEILCIQDKLKNLFFFDNITKGLPDYLYDKFKILKTYKEVSDLLIKDNRFIIGVGSPIIRHRLSQEFIKIGGALTSIIAPNASIGRWNCEIQQGVNIMQKVFISSDVLIEESVLINAGSNIHHDCKIGKYTEISPLVGIGGNCEIGEFCSIGLGAIILPNIEIGNNVIIGAGAVVTKNIKKNSIVSGIPAKPFLRKHK